MMQKAQSEIRAIEQGNGSASDKAAAVAAIQADLQTALATWMAQAQHTAKQSISETIARQTATLNLGHTLHPAPPIWPKYPSPPPPPASDPHLALGITAEHIAFLEAAVAMRTGQAVATWVRMRSGCEFMCELCT
jgi:hypothetical protein